MGEKTGKSSGKNLQKVAQFFTKPLISMGPEIMEIDASRGKKITKSSPIGRLNHGFGNTVI